MKVFSLKMSNDRPLTASLDETKVEAEVFEVFCPNTDSKDLKLRRFVTTSKGISIKLTRFGGERLAVVASALDKKFASIGEEMLFLSDDRDHEDLRRRTRGNLVTRIGAGTLVITYVVS